MTSRPVDVRGIGAYWSARGEDMFHACVRDRELLPAEQSIDVRFHEFMADDIAMVERIYDVAGQSFTGETRRAMGDFMASHPRGRHGTVVYDADVLGIDRDERRRALAFYSERFGVADEAPARRHQPG